MCFLFLFGYGCMVTFSSNLYAIWVVVGGIWLALRMLLFLVWCSRGFDVLVLSWLGLGWIFMLRF